MWPTAPRTTEEAAVEVEMCHAVCSADKVSAKASQHTQNGAHTRALRNPAQDFNYVVPWNKSRPPPPHRAKVAPLDVDSCVLGSGRSKTHQMESAAIFYLAQEFL